MAHLKMEAPRTTAGEVSMMVTSGKHHCQWAKTVRKIVFPSMQTMMVLSCFRRLKDSGEDSCDGMRRIHRGKRHESRTIQHVSSQRYVSGSIHSDPQLTLKELTDESQFIFKITWCNTTDDSVAGQDPRKVFQFRSAGHHVAVSGSEVLLQTMENKEDGGTLDLNTCDPGYFYLKGSTSCGCFESTSNPGSYLARNSSDEIFMKQVTGDNMLDDADIMFTLLDRDTPDFPMDIGKLLEKLQAELQQAVCKDVFKDFSKEVSKRYSKDSGFSDCADSESPESPDVCTAVEFVTEHNKTSDGVVVEVS